MQLTGLLLDHWLTHQYLDLDNLQPMTVIAGPNASGKTAIAEALAFGMTGELRRVAAKSDRNQLITEGSDRGAVRIEFEGVQVTRDVRTAKITAGGLLPVPEGGVTYAVPCLLDCRRFATESPEERSILLRLVMGADASPAAILKLLSARKHPPELLSHLPPEGSVDEWIKLATKGAAEARGAWKALTGQAYGTQKAAAFVVQPPDPNRAPRNLDELQGIEGTTMQRVLTVSQVAGAVAAREENKRRAAHLREQAAPLADLTAALGAAQIALAAATRNATVARDHKAELDAAADTPHMSCPNCNEPLQVSGAELVRVSRTPRQTANGDRTAAAIAVTHAERDGRAANAALTTLIEKVRAATAADDAFRLLAPPPDAPDDTAADVADRLAAAQAEHAAARAAVREEEEARAAAQRAENATRSAAQHHRDVLAWSAIGEDLAPNGIPGEILARVIGPINNLLRTYAIQTGWRQVAIGWDMAIRADGRPYALLSRSEQWRCDAMLTCALAAFSELGFVVLDEMDLLGVADRPRAMGWLHALTQSQQLDTVLLLATLTSPPAPPAGVTVIWLGTPAAVGATDSQGRAA